MAKKRKRYRRNIPIVPKIEKTPSGFELTFSKDILGVMYIVLFVFSAFARQGVAGPFGVFWDQMATMTFGLFGVYVFMVLLLIYGVMHFVARDKLPHIGRNFGIMIMVLSFLGLIQLLVGIDTYSATEDALKASGGWIGFVAAIITYFAVGEASKFVLLGTFVIGTLLAFEVSVKELFVFTQRLFTGKIENEHENGGLVINEREEIAKAILEKLQNGERGKRGNIRITDNEVRALASEIKPIRLKQNEDDLKVMTPSSNTIKIRDTLKIRKQLDESYKWEFPSVELLDVPEVGEEINDKELRNNAKKIADKLEMFGIKVRVRDVKVGPTVMQYSVEPAEDVKLSKITALRDDLKLALAAESLRIEAPIPGKALVGIEIPNEKRTNVRIKEMLLSDAFYRVDSNLRFPLGKDVSGHPIVSDIAAMPHLLIAGQTGSGKSVCINSLIVSLLYQNSPRDLRMILIDPKRVELKLYNHIPHLLTPVITDISKAINALRWLVTEMNHRYVLLENVGARNREEFNKKVEKEKKLPHIICIVDELAELMMSGDKKSIEGYICRIAQLARAVGIHLIVATQRPSVDVITGLIKANIPSRIAFKVASGIDARTVLDQIGAEDLLGKGDMLYMPPNTSEPLRIQGVAMPTHEIERVVNMIKLSPEELGDVQYIEEITSPSTENPLSGSVFAAGSDGDDALIGDAMDVLRSAGKASTSFLQRRLKIGYSRAARLLDLLEERGIVGPAEGSKPRKVYLDNSVPEDNI